MPSDLFIDILSWSTSLPLWQRDALRRLFTQGDLSTTDLDTLARLCMAQRGIGADEALAPVPLVAEHLPISSEASGVPVALRSLTHHHGVNALAAEQTISFGPQLTIVYGPNAAGKSGYTRILKQACRSRAVDAILGNVLDRTAQPLKPNATIRIRHGDLDADVQWAPDGPASPALAQISVFDSRCVPVYLRDKTDVAFRPFSLDLFDKLAAACSEVKKRLVPWIGDYCQKSGHWACTC